MPDNRETINHDESTTINKEPLRISRGGREWIWAERNQEFSLQQTPFTNETNNIVLVPLKKELLNGHLATFIKQLLSQDQLASGKIGVIFLINDDRSDNDYSRGNYGKEAVSRSAIPENQLTATWFRLLGMNSLSKIEALAIPQQYKDLAHELADNPKIQIRYDYISLKDEVSFGLLRKNLFDLVNSYRPPSLTENQIIIHLSDIDTYFSTNHFARLEKYYTDPLHIANISEWDYVPGVQEGDSSRDDMSRIVLSTIDKARAFQYALDLNSILLGRYNAGTPTISGRMSVLAQQEIQGTLASSSINEDYAVSSLLRQQLGNTLGHEGEVYRLDRASADGYKASNDSKMRYDTLQKQKIPKINPDAQRIIDEAQKDANHVRMMNALIGIRDQIIDLAQNKGHDLFVKDRDWMDDPKHYRSVFRREIELVKQALAKDMPEIAQLIHEADRTDPCGASILYASLIKAMIEWKNLFNQRREERVSEYEFGSKEEQRDFSKHALSAIAWDLFYDKIKGVKTTFHLPQETREYVQYTRRLVEKEFLHGKNLNSDPEFTALLQEEQLTEQAKVRLRNVRLERFVRSRIADSNLSETDHRIVDPYVRYFPETVSEIEALVAEGYEIYSIVMKIAAQHQDLFNYDAGQHKVIAELRALKLFALRKNLNILNDQLLEERVPLGQRLIHALKSFKLLHSG